MDTITSIPVVDILDAIREETESWSRRVIIEQSPHRDAMRSMAAKYLKKFFVGKTGRRGAIYDKDIITAANINAVLHTAIIDGFEHFYEILADQGGDDPDREIKYLVSLLHDCRRLRIPQTLVGGIACVHARLVGEWKTTNIKEIVDQTLDEMIDENDSEEPATEPDELELAMVADQFDLTG